MKSSPPGTIVRRRITVKGEGIRIVQFLKDCWSELKLTQRPTNQEVTSYSLAVLIVILASATYLAILDFIFARIFALFR
ncbi:MAG: preprotein translocase subunit SecE [Candidatus Fervidibacter sp.]|uniref:preprotein translocase subunit SecE n=1 Tax=Candidatus Fervidibacter sp. TaxID=3100871 RepID=UPI00404B292E